MQATTRRRAHQLSLFRTLGLALSLGSIGCTGERPTGDDQQSAEGSSTARQDPPSILLVSIDTTRADRLGTYGYRPTSTPNIDAWASEGVVFEKALTPIPITLPAHTSMLTGLLPHHHGARDNGTYRAADDVPTLASTLSKHGYDTAAVVAAAVLDRQYGLDRGFARYDDGGRSSGAGLAIAERGAGAVTDAAIAIADELEPPFFLFVHYFDPHATYAPPPPFAERHRTNLYQGELAYVDDQIGRLRRELEAAGSLANTVVVMTSDHGEGLGEHEEATHGVFLYQSTLHVPLIVVAPGRWPAGTRVSELVSLVDVAPTLYALAGASPPSGLDGLSLQTFVGPDAQTRQRWLPLESEFGFNSYGWAPLVGLTDGAVKWVGAPRDELYDLETDPNEDTDIAAARADEVQRLVALHGETVTADRRVGALDVTDPEQAQRLAELRALGYVAGSRGDPDHQEELTDPKDGISTLDTINEGRRLMSEGRHREAADLLERVAAMSPRNVSALVLTGAAYIMAGNPQAALDPLDNAERIAPQNADVHFNLGLAWLGINRPDRAEAAWRRALELAPRHEQAAINLIDLLIRTGRPREAAPILRAVRQRALSSPLFDYLEGKLAILRNDREAARTNLNRALAAGLPPAVAEDARTLLKAIE